MWYIYIQLFTAKLRWQTSHKKKQQSELVQLNFNMISNVQEENIVRTIGKQLVQITKSSRSPWKMKL